MRSLSIVFLTVSLIFVISCSIGVLNQTEVDPWLNTISGDKPAEIDITGKWHDEYGSTFFRWGEGYLRQEQNKVSGVIGDYNIEGIVSGKIVYLVLLYKNNVYYTARLEMFQGSLRGNYFRGNDKKQTKGYPTALARTVEPGEQ